MFLSYMAPFILSLKHMSHLVSFVEKQPKKHEGSTPMLHSRYGILWLVSFILVPSHDLFLIHLWIQQMDSDKLEKGFNVY